MDISISLGIIGFFLALLAVVVVFRTLLVWRGILRSALFLFLIGFVFLSGGFLVTSLDLTGAFYGATEALFALGTASLLWGSKKIFAFV